jgi:hypothetical protein
MKESSTQFIVQWVFDALRTDTNSLTLQSISLLAYITPCVRRVVKYC